MAATFKRTSAYLATQERPPRRAMATVGALTLAVWASWMLLSSTTVYAVSEEGSLLAAGAASPIQSSVAGVVKVNRLVLGSRVKAGDEIVVLDSAAEELRRAELKLRLEATERAADTLEEIAGAEVLLASASTRAGNSRVAAASVRRKVASDVAALTRKQDEAMQRLKDAALVSGIDALRTAEDMQRQRGQVLLSSADAAMAAADVDKARREADVRLLTLKKEITDLRAKVAEYRVIVEQENWEIARRTLRAPVDGVVADVGGFPKGAAVAPNQTVAIIVPDAELKWVAHFPPSEAVGRIHPGQRGRVRLDAFPWTAYGALAAEVVSVGSEPNNQRIRVEFRVQRGNDNLALSHGMTGNTDVEVEQMSPLRLLLRLAGQKARTDAVRPAAPASQSERK